MKPFQLRWFHHEDYLNSSLMTFLITPVGEKDGQSNREEGCLSRAALQLFKDKDISASNDHHNIQLVQLLSRASFSQLLLQKILPPVPLLIKFIQNA